jgi:MFS family permease
MGTVTLLTGSYQQALMFLTYPVWGRMIDRFGSHRMLALAAFGNALFPLPWIFMTRGNVVTLLLFGYLITGMSNPGLALAQQNYIMHIAPKENRSVYFGAFAAIVQVSNACGALLSGYIVMWLEGSQHVVFGLTLDHFKMVFLISLIARLSCMVLLIPLRHAERRAGK